MLKNQQQKIATQGFTLVELSIVIIIIGFLIAGIAAGTSLIKQAEINSVVTDFQGYQTAYNNFLGRYGQAPGDFSAGATVWTTCATTAANCTGDANGVIDINTANEPLAAWRELSLAGMISSGVVDVDTTITAAAPIALGSGVPLSKVSAAGYMMIQGADTVITSLTAATSSLWNDGKTNAVFLGAPSATQLFLDRGGITAQDAYNLDKKLDDGSVSGAVFSGAQSGSVRVFEDPNAATANDCLTAGNEAQAAGANTYNIAGVSATCVIGIALN